MAWIRANHILAFVLSRFFIKMGYYRIEPGPPRKVVVDGGRAFHVATLPSTERVSPWIEVLSLVPIVLGRVFIPLLLGYAVIAERYVIDSVVTIAYTLGNNDFLHSTLCRVLLRMIPDDALLIYLRAEYSKILDRRGEDGRGPAFIEHQVREYDRVAAAMQCPVISTDNRSISDSQRLLRELISDYHRRRGLP